MGARSSVNHLYACGAGQFGKPAMPSANCAGASSADRSTSTRTTAVLMPASLSGGQEDAAMTANATDLTVASWPGFAPRLLRVRRREDYADYARLRWIPATRRSGRLLDEVDRSGLLGRGGAAFPLAVKLRTVRDAGRGGPDCRARQRRRGRTRIGQGPVVVAQPAAPGTRWCAPGGRDGGGAAPMSTFQTPRSATPSKLRCR